MPNDRPFDKLHLVEVKKKKSSSNSEETRKQKEEKKTCRTNASEKENCVHIELAAEAYTICLYSSCSIAMLIASFASTNYKEWATSIQLRNIEIEQKKR